MYDPYSLFENEVLLNGLRLHVLCVPEISFEIVTFIVHTGGFKDPASAPGLAHFLEHVVCSSSGRTVTEMSRFFGNEGGDFSANTDGKRTEYGFVAPISSPRFQEFADFFGTALLNPKFDTVVERERATILSEFGNRFKSEKDVSFKLALNSALYPGTPLATTLGGIGTKESVRSISTEQLYEHHKTHYVPKNISVVCVGGMSVREVVSMLERAGFDADVPHNEASGRQKFQMPKKPSKALLECNFADEGKVLNSTCAFHWLVEAEHIVVSFYTNIVSQLLMSALRGNDTSIVYGAHAEMEDLRDFIGLTVVAENFLPEYEKMVQAVMQEQVDAVPQYESLFNEDKRSRLLGFTMRDETLRSVSEDATRSLLKYGKIKSLKEYMGTIESVTFDDVINVARQVTNERRLIVFERH